MPRVPVATRPRGGRHSTAPFVLLVSVQAGRCSSCSTHSFSSFGDVLVPVQAALAGEAALDRAAERAAALEAGPAALRGGEPKARHQRGQTQPSARLPFCRHSLIVFIKTPTKREREVQQQNDGLTAGQAGRGGGARGGPHAGGGRAAPGGEPPRTLPRSALRALQCTAVHCAAFFSPSPVPSSSWMFIMDDHHGIGFARRPWFATMVSH